MICTKTALFPRGQSINWIAQVKMSPKLLNNFFNIFSHLMLVAHSFS